MTDHTTRCIVGIVGASALMAVGILFSVAEYKALVRLGRSLGDRKYSEQEHRTLATTFRRLAQQHTDPMMRQVHQQIAVEHEQQARQHRREQLWWAAA